MTNGTDELISLPDVAMRFRVPYTRVYPLALRGELGAVKRVGTRLYVARAAVEALEASRALAGTP